MEQSNHSAAVISLGKKLVEELKLSKSSNTLGRWMAHYLAELIVNTENEPGAAKKRKMEKECVDMILKIWSTRKDLPAEVRPLSNFKDALYVLHSMKRKPENVENWRAYIQQDEWSDWGRFTRKMVAGYDQMILLSIFATLSGDLLEKEKEWLKHAELLSADELTIIKYIDFLLDKEEFAMVKIIIDGGKKSNENDTRLNKILDKLSFLNHKQQECIEELKRKVSTQIEEEEDLPEDLAE